MFHAEFSVVVSRAKVGTLQQFSPQLSEESSQIFLWSQEACRSATSIIALKICLAAYPDENPDGIKYNGKQWDAFSARFA